MPRAVLGNDPVAADLDILQAQAEIAGLGAHSPFAMPVHPAQIGSAGRVELLQIRGRLVLETGLAADLVFVLDLYRCHATSLGFGLGAPPTHRTFTISQPPHHRP